MLIESELSLAGAAGVDEVGRGPLAGPVLAAAVILDPADLPAGLTDSKKLSARQRERLAAVIYRRATAIGFGRAEVDEIDAVNILQATMRAMQRAVAALPEQPRVVYVDGNRAPAFGVPAVPVVGGDAKIAAISAASIVAKVARDAEMSVLGEAYPGYGFEQHKGYGTAAHLAALQKLGPTPHHRRSFAPVAALLRSAETSDAGVMS